MFNFIDYYKKLSIEDLEKEINQMKALLNQNGDKLSEPFKKYIEDLIGEAEKILQDKRNNI